MESDVGQKGRSSSSTAIALSLAGGIIIILSGSIMPWLFFSNYHNTKDWIKNIINPIRALTKIRQSLYLLGYKFEVRTSKDSKEPKNYSFYELETKSFEKLLEAFARLYPYVYKELGKVNDDLSKTTESWKKSMERAGCKHEYKMEIKGEHKYFECFKCEAKITIQSSGIIKDQKLVDKMNKIKRPQNANCIKFGHQWQNRTGYQVDCVCYICAICGESVTFSTDSQEKIDIIDEEVSIKVGIGYIGLCRDIEYFFHQHNNEELTINDFLKFFKDFRMEDLKTFKRVISTIIDILIEHRYLKLQIPHNNLLKRVYKREYRV